ncbi:glycosyl transferase [Virgisporangium aliadipatigenens]|uniref:Glycosyl transferase n=1 Tax=Virgisporangium aliadipatigenens TaxID=741659 RepID=A0A8J3YNS0_9ACTN|nr:glycosyltransferase [Virgisporangium aliadipatigenens]GIJ47181.1 glycosyl transferase [Virgisporangium aliadipatigenens]
MYRAATYRLGIVSTYVPRRCGLATYTADLREALGVATDDIESVVVAIDRDGLSYGDEVVATIRQDHIADYEDVAERIRSAGIDVVLIQHEYGIFGGPNGSHVLHLARALTTRGIPYLVTLHTLLSTPTPGQAATLTALCAGAAGVTVFTETARRMAVAAGIAAAHQITVVPHGAPSVLRTAPPPTALDGLLESFGDDPVLTTFGLVSAGKGLEDAISAMAAVVARHPRARYVIAGATHPEVVRHEGESYRDGLHERVRSLGLTDNVHFVDSFLTPAELSALLRRTTIFVTPYLSPEQICSGALTFAVAAGCPVVSTAYRYAEDLLANGAGIIVPCHDVAGLSDAVNRLLDDPALLAQTRAAADARGAGLVWPAVALIAGDLIRSVARHSPGHAVTRLGPLSVPPLRLDHLRRLTDEFGIIEFCRGREPDLAYGYNVDDVSRLAIVAAELLTLGQGGDLPTRWIRLALRFLRAALGSTVDSAVMHNRMTYGGSWTDRPHPGDHVGRTVWALGVLAGTPAVPDPERRDATDLLDALGPRVPELAAIGLRSVAYALLGLVRADRTAHLPQLVSTLDRELRAHASGGGWYWFEPELTYDNARLPQALLAGAAALGDRATAARALNALDWYVAHVGLTDGTLRNVGNRWHRRDDDPVRWGDAGDEQPIDTAAAVDATVEAWAYTGSPRYADLAGVAYSWFHGRNRAGAVLYETDTGACHDGLAATTANPNCGAESTLAHQQSLVTLLRAGLAAWPDRPKAGHRVGNRLRTAAAAPPPATPAAPGRTTPPVRPKHRTRTTEGQNDAR